MEHHRLTLLAGSLQYHLGGGSEVEDKVKTTVGMELLERRPVVRRDGR